MIKLKSVLLFIILFLVFNLFYYRINAENVETEMEIDYTTHIQDYGWQDWKKDGDLAGTTGESKRLEGIKIKGENIPQNSKIQYQVHVQDYGWQDWKENGALAGTTGESKRLEGIRIHLVNLPEFTVRYRVHVEDYGWQDWKEDGALAGTTGKSKRLEAIEIKIVKKENKGQVVLETKLNNKKFYKDINISGWKMSNLSNTKVKVLLEDEDITSNVNLKYQERPDIEEKILYGNQTQNNKSGFSFLIKRDMLIKETNKLEIQLLNEDETVLLDKKINNILLDSDLHIEYCTHVQDYGWQDWKKDGELSGTTGKSKRLEGIKIKGENILQNSKIQYQVHVQDYGWQDWKENGDLSGTTGESKRLEGIRIQLINLPEYTIRYRVHVEDYGWQDWKEDGALAGTIGKSKRLEAIEIKIVKRENKGQIVLETKLDNEKFYKDINVSGWKMSNLSNTKVKVLLEDEDITSNVNLKYKEMSDIEEKILYGNQTQNNKPGFSFLIKRDMLIKETNKLEIQLLNEDETILLDRSINNILIDNDLHIDYCTHIQDYGWQDYVSDGTTSGTTGRGLRVEAITINAFNLPDDIELSFCGHIQDYGWQDIKTNGEIIGTIGESKRIEAFKIWLKNTDKYSIMYRAHLQDYGWQDWSYDGEMAGTMEESKRVEAIQIKITKKIKEDKIRLYFDELPYELINESYTIKGWYMTNISNTKLQLLIDGNLYTENFERTRDQSVYNQIKGYGGEEFNPTPRAKVNVDFSKYSIGYHTLKMKVLSQNGKVLAEQSRGIELKRRVDEGIYGISGLRAAGDYYGQDLKYYKIGNGPNVFFATFAIHGWEDDFDFDGQELTKIAERFKDNLKSMQDDFITNKWTIYILPSLNPDGEYHGWTHNGPGRTTLYSAANYNQGIDMNRTWSTDWSKNTSARNFTGTEPFLAYEARYLRDFLLSHKSANGQTVLVDLHGWLNETMGDDDIGWYYRDSLGMSKHIYSYGRGYLINWARANLGSGGRTARACLVELPEAYSSDDVANWGLADRFISATINMLRGI